MTITDPYDTDLGVDPLADVDPDQAPPTDASEAFVDQMLRALGRTRARIARNASIVNAHKAHLDDWLIEQNAPLAARENRILAWLQAVHAHRLDSDPDGAKTLTYPAGTLAARKAADRIVVDDQQAGVDWLLEHAPSFVNVPPMPAPKIAAGDLKKAASNELGARVVWDGDTGRVLIGGGEVPGVHVERSGDLMAGEWRTWNVLTEQDW